MPQARVFIDLSLQSNWIAQRTTFDDILFLCLQISIELTTDINTYYNKGHKITK